MNGLDPAIVNVLPIFVGFDMEVAKLVGSRHQPNVFFFLLPFLQGALVKGGGEVVFDFAVLDVVVPAFVEFVEVVSGGDGVFVLDFLEELLVLFVDAEDEGFEGTFYFFLLPTPLQVYLVHTLLVDLLLALLLNHHFGETVDLVAQVLPQDLP